MAQATQVRRQSADRKGRGSQTTWYQANAMLEWIETPADFKLITGGAATNQVVAGSKVKKTYVYRDLESKTGDTADPARCGTSIKLNPALILS